MSLKPITYCFATFFVCLQLVFSQGKNTRFQMDKDFLLAQFDCKTDVDDLHSVAALAMLLSHPDFSMVKYHAVAGTYGVQEGLYVPPNSLFQLAFGENWTDAHEDFEACVDTVRAKAQEIISAGGDIWIAEAGQSDFSAELIKALKKNFVDIDLSQRIHLVQHSDWNEKVTSSEKLQYVKVHSDYIKIPDGNTVGNNSPGFNSPEFKNWETLLSDKHIIDVWRLAIELGNQYNGKEGRYTNQAILDGGLDFSDISETCYILGLLDIKDTSEFFHLFGN